MAENSNDNYIGIDEAAEYLGIKTVTLRNWIKRDENLPAHKIGKLRKLKNQNWMNGFKVVVVQLTSSDWRK
jgi:excisionase family DNA binding protein|nr:MAG TPA: helix-turn-helix domain protein [Caudoviricetes sp.]